ncbi:hypothetical protein TTY48_40620 [Tsukamurella sp. TY48]|nr:hypothetical protein TTY48_40620 [Tsukamurella sp. TY48]
MKKIAHIARLGIGSVTALTLTLGLAPITQSQAAPSRCGSNYYENAAGNCVQRPSGPANSTGSKVRCSDGTYSFSETNRGMCSAHGGTGRATKPSTAKPRASSPRTTPKKPSASTSGSSSGKSGSATKRPSSRR